MWTGFGVDALIGQTQPFNRSATDQVLLHNLRRILRLDVSVPHSLWIHNDSRPVLALVKAS